MSWYVAEPDTSLAYVGLDLDGVDSRPFLTGEPGEAIFSRVTGAILAVDASQPVADISGRSGLHYLVVSGAVAAAIRELDAAGLELYDVEVGARRVGDAVIELSGPEVYFAVHFRDHPAAVDASATEGRLSGEVYRRISSLALDESALAGRHLARFREYPYATLLSETFKSVVDDRGFTGLRFVPVSEWDGFGAYV